MTTHKKRLQGLLLPDASDSAQPIQRGAPYQLSTQARDTEPALPPQVAALSAPLQEIARRYIGARRRSGEALLEAARWLSEARALASHGDWQIFKEATGTSDDTAERLLNIHIQAMQNPQFADSVARNWLSQSTAALLARQSTPPSVMEAMLNAAEPPKVKDIRRAIREAQEAEQPSATPSGIDRLAARMASALEEEFGIPVEVVETIGTSSPPAEEQHIAAAASPDDIPPPQERGLVDAAPSEAREPPLWFGPTHSRLVAAAELVAWCAEQRAQLGADERALLAEDARQLISELQKLLDAMS